MSNQLTFCTSSHLLFVSRSDYNGPLAVQLSTLGPRDTIMMQVALPLLSPANPQATPVLQTPQPQLAGDIRLRQVKYQKKKRFWAICEASSLVVASVE